MRTSVRQGPCLPLFVTRALFHHLFLPLHPRPSLPLSFSPSHLSLFLPPSLPMSLYPSHPRTSLPLHIPGWVVVVAVLSRPHSVYICKAGPSYPPLTSLKPAAEDQSMQVGSGCFLAQWRQNRLRGHVNISLIKNSIGALSVVTLILKHSRVSGFRIGCVFKR